MPAPDKAAYSRLETDAELLARLPYRPSYYMQPLEGAFLDDVVWSVFKLQRKIVWVAA